MNKKFLLLSLPLALMLSACTGNTEQTEVIPQKKSMIVKEQVCDVHFDLPAQLKGRQDIDIIPQITARLEHLLVSEGQTVKKGQKMFVLEQTEYIAALQDAEAKVASAKASVGSSQIEVDAEKALLDKGIISQYKYDLTYNDLLSAKAKLDEAEAAVVRAKNNLSYTVICAPSDGVVGDINYRIGALVSPSISKPITVISDISTVYAYCSVNETVYAQMLKMVGSRDSIIAKMPKCNLRMVDGEVYPFEGKVETVSGIIDRSTGAVNIRAAFPNPKTMLSSGGSATLVLTGKEKGLVVPRSATFEIQDKVYAYKLIKQDTSYVSQSTIIEVSRISDKDYFVFDGLKDGDTIAIDGVRKMSNNMKFIPVITTPKDSLISSADSIK